MSIRSSRGSLVLILATLGLACAAPRFHDRSMSFQPRGPGVVYDSIEAAAVDGLAYSHKVARENRHRGRMYGGTVYAVPGGFTYSEVAHASDDEPFRLSHRLRKIDVAQFHTYPRTADLEQNMLNEAHSSEDQQSVDRQDPLHRPLFILTPRLVVRTYRGEQLPVEDVAYLGPPDDDFTLAGTPAE